MPLSARAGLQGPRCAGVYGDVLGCAGVYGDVLGYAGVYWGVRGCAGVYWDEGRQFHQPSTTKFPGSAWVSSEQDKAPVGASGSFSLPPTIHFVKWVWE